MLRIGIGRNFYTAPYGLEAGVARMRSHGYTAMDYPEFVQTETELFQMNHSEFEKYLRKQSEIYQREGVEVFQSHGPWRYPPRDMTAEDREERFEKMSKAIEGTAILGCRNIVIHPLMPLTVDDEGHEKETYEINREFMRRLCRVAREYDVVINFENMPMRHLSLASTERILAFVKEMNDEYFKVCLDTGHSATLGDSPAKDVKMLGKKYLYSLHIHDNDGRHDYHWQPFAGVIDWEDFCKSLKEISFDGVINMEVARQRNLPKELREMEELFTYRKLEYLAKLASAEQ